MYSSTNVHNDPERPVKDPAPGASTAQCSVTVTTTRYKKLLQIQKKLQIKQVLGFSWNSSNLHSVKQISCNSARRPYMKG